MRRLVLLILGITLIVVLGNIICTTPKGAKTVQLHSAQRSEDTTNSRYSPFMDGYIADNGDIAKAIERGEYDSTRNRGKVNNVQRRTGDSN